MSRTSPRRPTLSGGLAVLALVVAASGTAYAAVNLPKNSVGAKQIQTSAVRSAEVKNGSLKAKDLKPGVIPVTPETLYVEISDPNGVDGPSVTAGNVTPTVVFDAGPDFYIVTFDRPITECVVLGSSAGFNGNTSDKFVNVVKRGGTDNALNVEVTDASAGIVTDFTAFTLAVLCAR